MFYVAGVKTPPLNDPVWVTTFISHHLTLISYQLQRKTSIRGIKVIQTRKWLDVAARASCAKLSYDPLKNKQTKTEQISSAIWQLTSIKARVVNERVVKTPFRLLTPVKSTGLQFFHGKTAARDGRLIRSSRTPEELSLSATSTSVIDDDSDHK